MDPVEEEEDPVEEEDLDGVQVLEDPEDQAGEDQAGDRDLADLGVVVEALVSFQDLVAFLVGVPTVYAA